MRHPFLRTLAGSGVTTDPNFENVTLLLHGDGTNGGQNNTFVDGSTNNFTITRNGNTTQGTFSPYGDNWSNFFDGSGDTLSAADNAAFDLSNGAFTIEAFVYLRGNTQFGVIIGQWGTVGNNGYVLRQDAGFKAQFVHTTNGSTESPMTASTAIPLNKWIHVAVVRNSSSTLSLFVDGVREATNASFTATIFDSSLSLRVGGEAGGVNTNGHISNVRVVKGTAVYDPTQSTLTVPTSPLTAISNTSLLTCQSNRFRDASTNNFTITRNGDVSVQRFSPFSPTAAYAAGTIGGSGYFDGTDDYLSAADSANLRPGAGAFTIEAWIYRNATGAAHTIYAKGGASTGIVFQVTSGNVLRFTHTTTNIDSTGTIRGSSWNHVAVVREGTGTNQTKLYINGVQDGQGTVSTDFTQTDEVRVGTNRGATEDLNGYLSDVRFVKGTAVYTATFAPPSSPLSAITDTQFLCVFQNAAILDNAMMAVPETVGNAQIDTTVKKYGTGSMEFDGTGDWLLVPDSIDQRLGTGNFTIECWLYLSATGTARGIVGKGTSTTGWLLSTNTSNAVVFTYGTSTITSTGTLSGTTWYHIAVVREGTGTNQTKIYIGGTNDGTGTVSTDFTQTNAAYVGANRTGGDPMNGYIDDLRITKGVARYTATFTPPTAAFPDL